MYMYIYLYIIYIIHNESSSIGNSDITLN